MGKTRSNNSKATSSNALAVQLDAQGDVKFDLIAKQGANKNKIIHSRFTDLLPKQVTEDDTDLVRPDQDSVKEVRRFYFSTVFIHIYRSTFLQSTHKYVMYHFT